MYPFDKYCVFCSFYFSSTLALAATARGGVLTTSCWNARADHVVVSCYPVVYISISSFQSLFCDFYVLCQSREQIRGEVG